jgi:predicted amidohydrolase
MQPLIADAARHGARLILFSENALNGYDFAGAGVRSALPLDAPLLARLDTLARQYHIVIVAGFFEREADKVYNAVGAFFPDGRRVVQRKHNVTPKEKDMGVSAGPRERTLFEVDGLKFAMLICADTGVEGLQDELAKAGCDAVLVPTAGLGDAAKGYHQADLADAAVRERFTKDSESVGFPTGAVKAVLERNMALVACNQKGYDAELGYFHCGHSMVVDRTGDVTALNVGHFCFEHLRPAVAVGFITRRAQ